MSSFSYDKHPELAVEYEIQHYKGAQCRPSQMEIFNARKDHDRVFRNQEQTWDQRRQNNIAHIPFIRIDCLFYIVGSQ